MLPCSANTPTQHATHSALTRTLRERVHSSLPKINMQEGLTVSELAARFQGVPAVATPATAQGGAAPEDSAATNVPRRRRTFGGGMGNHAMMTAEDFRMRKKRQEEEYRRAREFTCRSSQRSRCATQAQRHGTHCTTTFTERDALRAMHDVGGGIAFAGLQYILQVRAAQLARLHCSHPRPALQCSVLTCPLYRLTACTFPQMATW